MISASQTFASSEKMIFEFKLCCSKCSFEGKTISEMDQHERIHLSPTRRQPMKWETTAPLSCPNCYFVGKDVSELLQHQNVHIGRKWKITCPSCLGTSGNTRDLIKHFSLMHVTTFQSLANETRLANEAPWP